MKLLMIEDNVSVCEMIEMFFMKEEIDATFVHDGKQGYETFLKEDFDIAIIDLMLPNMDPRQVFSREQLLEQVWGYQFYGDERTVDVHIKRLRQKIATDTKPFLHTIWGVGYKFDETE
ncbi:response regulator transcription factor [Listeria welshimeri]|uniref:response regulator transcription factor n=1 Tax=Listeria welshimeri TaxID=1643 RepID=UPI0018886413|nr:response regulator transcription factor [Listeria welshimeri]MBF2595585.1 winged helix-turn-helix domain-containing protein [Listeria welshimeri]